jgi:hypothetical protein
MDKSTKKLCAVAAGAALLAGCASMYQADEWNLPAAGSTWKMSQKNTGSYGKDAELVLTRSEGEWQGHRIVKITNTANGGGIISLPNGKWLGMVDGNGRMVAAYDPPQGYIFPLRVGQAWDTHHRATNYMSGRSVEYDYRCKVEALEKVTVPAGTFDAFRIACETEFSRDLSWFSPKYGVHVKQDMRRKPASPQGEGTQLAELVALNLAK